jgi:hypothetical protein
MAIRIQLVNLSADTIIAIAAVVIAASALFVAIYEARQLRKHNRLSVIPKLRIDACTELSKDITISLINSGLGPAIIKSAIVGLDTLPNVAETIGDFTKTWKAALLKLPAKLNIQYTATTPFRGDAFAQNEHMFLLKFHESAGASEKQEAIKSFLRRMHFIIEYESLYGDLFRIQGKILPYKEEISTP